MDSIAIIWVVSIWLLLILIALLALGALAVPRHVRRPAQVRAWLTAGARRRRADDARRAAVVAEQVRYAEEVAVAARGAASTAEWHQAECERAQQRVTETWRAYQAADEALTRVRRASAFAGLERVDPADRERALRRSAQSAHRRGDLSDTQLLDALTHRHGWDPALHPVDQELMIAKAVVRHHAELHRRALDAESEAWRAAGVASAALRTLRQELVAAEHAPVPARAVPVELQETVVIRRPAHV